ncbi:MAG: hypothetical protein SO179_02575 [Bacteroidales bacterium]|nr:hypothetical protein [Bacteroidales bacterium]
MWQLSQEARSKSNNQMVLQGEKELSFANVLYNIIALEYLN